MPFIRRLHILFDPEKSWVKGIELYNGAHLLKSKLFKINVLLPQEVSSSLTLMWVCSKIKLTVWWKMWLIQSYACLLSYFSSNDQSNFGIKEWSELDHSIYPEEMNIDIQLWFMTHEVVGGHKVPVKPCGAVGAIDSKHLFNGPTTSPNCNPTKSTGPKDVKRLVPQRGPCKIQIQVGFWRGLNFDDVNIYIWHGSCPPYLNLTSRWKSKVETCCRNQIWGLVRSGCGPIVADMYPIRI